MKTSKKILLTFTGIFVAFLVSSLVIVRNELQPIIDNYGKAVKYAPVPVEPFDQLIFSSNWKVEISQSRNFSVEIETGEEISSNLKNENGKLFFITDSTMSDRQIRVRIKMPFISGIRASGNSELLLDSFNQDSLNVFIEDSVKFISADNVIVDLAVQTTDKAKVIIKDDPMD